MQNEFAQLQALTQPACAGCDERTPMTYLEPYEDLVAAACGLVATSTTVAAARVPT